MYKLERNIFANRDTFLGREEKERILGQKGLVIWFTGLSGSGKSTLAKNLELKLNQEGILTQVLDGDKIRKGLNNNLGFSAEDRNENIRRIAEVARLFCDCGFVVLSAFISPTVDIRDMAKQIIGAENYFEVFVSTPLEICEKRDVKGLYKKAREGVVKDFTGISAPYEDPENPSISINTINCNVEECVNIIFEKLNGRILG
ncbi:MAG: adenylyl-sulfate kinase [Bacteroidales bacterium]|nr:adenylyl-sulfate kinase [Bacteroidales bacterium]